MDRLNLAYPVSRLSRELPMKKLIILVTASLILTGCVGVGTYTANYTEPVAKEIENKKLINESFDVIWDRVVANLSESYFVINNIDKQSRLINLSFSTDSPEEYINCGESYRTFSFNKRNETYTYQTAESTSFKLPHKWGPNNNLPAVTNVTIDTSLEGRVNIYLAPIEQNSTRFSTNVRYVFTTSVSGISYGYNMYGTLIRKDNMTAIPNANTVTSFNTGKIGISKRYNDVDDVKCQSKGVLEEQLLNMAKKLN